MKNFVSGMNLKIIQIIAIFSCIFVQYISYLKEKTFWLDEWFVIYNLKFKTFAQIVSKNLDFQQQMPTGIWIFYKIFGGLFEYSYLSLRILPFMAQLIAIFILVKYVFKKIGINNLFDQLLYIVAYLACDTTVFYFMQVKQYSFESLGIVLGLYQFGLFLENIV